MVNWNSIGNVGSFSNSSRCGLISCFPLLKGNDRLAVLPMTWLTQDWTIIKGLHSSGWSDTGVVQVAWHWRIGSPLAYFDIYWGRFGSSGSWVTQWLCSGTVAVHWVDSNLADAEYFAEIEASDWSRARNPGFWLVERTLRKCSKGVPLRSWISANGSLLKLFYTVRIGESTQDWTINTGLVNWYRNG